MGMTLKAARVNKGLTQQEAAELLNISKTTLCAWENFKSFPTVDQVPLIEKTYGVKYNDLVFLPCNYTKSVTEEVQL